MELNNTSHRLLKDTLMFLITFHLSLIYKIIKFLATVTILDSCYKSATR